MKDIGMHPDHKSMSPDQKNYEITHGDGSKCPWCEEDIVIDEGLEFVFLNAIEESRTEESCGNCGAELKITYLFVELAYPYSARVDFEIEATKKVA